jgi:methyl-accepting chemotaxis protein
MKMLDNVKIGKKLVGGFVLVAAIAAAVGIYGVVKIHAVNAADTVLYDRMTVPLGELVDVTNAFQNIRVVVRDIILAGTVEERATFVARLAEFDKAFADSMAKYENSIVSDQMKAVFADFKRGEQLYLPIRGEIVKLAKAGKRDDALKSLQDAQTAAKVMEDAINTMAVLKVADARAQSEGNTATANSAVMLMTVLIGIGALIAIGLGVMLSRSITGPLVRGVEMMVEMAKGHLGLRLKMDRQDEIGELAQAMDGFANDLQGTVIGTIQKIAAGDLSVSVVAKDGQDEISPALTKTVESLSGLVAEANRLTRAVVEGKLAVRGDAARFQGAYRDIVGGVNNLCDAFVGPITVTAQYVDRISRGDIPPKITDTYQGDFNEIKNNLNLCIDSLNGFVSAMKRMSDDHTAGDIDVTVPVEKFTGAYRVMAQGVNDLAFGHIAVKKKAMDCVAEFGRGNFEAPLEKFPGKKAFINDTIEQVRGNLKRLIVDTDMLVQAAADGRLDVRADGTKHLGDFQRIVQGFNDTITNIVNPLMVTADHVDKISKGVIPSTIATEYRGQYNVIKTNLNQCITAVNALVTDTGLLVDAAVGGRLSIRADTSKHQGDFRKIIEGVNRTLDAVTTPIEEARRVLEKVAAQDLRVSVTGDYAGDHASIKNSINTMVSDLRQNIGQISQNAHSLGTSAEELTNISQQMAGNAEETSTQTNVVSAASEQVSRNLTVVATSSEEMLASIREIAKSSNEAARMAKNAVTVADATNQTVQKLGDASMEIGKVIKVITSIAEQTNLLALNATIEAARAGDAGKGFAVVANEVKELAKETAKATEDISRKIEAIQSETQGAVQAIAQISALIGQIDSVSNTIASAVEEQTATTNEIGRNLSEAVKGSSEISQNISGVAQAAQSTTAGASDTQRAAKALSEMASQLQSLVGRFAA